MVLKKNHSSVKNVLALLSAGKVPGLIVDSAGKIVAATPQFRELTHIGGAGKELRDYFKNVPSLNSIPKRKQVKLRLKSSDAVLVARLVKPDSDRKLLAIVFDRPSEDGLEPAHRFPHVFHKDITNEKNLERRLQLFHSAFEHSTDAIIITGVDGKIVDVNDAFSRIYGYTRDEVIGKSTALIQSRHSTPEFYRQLWSSLTEKGQWHGEIINTRKDGSEIPVWLSITPIYLEGAKIGYMGIESDISEKKNLEQQIIQTEKLATIGQLAAGIAHEIGTPLNIISGNAEYMLLDMHESDKGFQELSVIINQTKRMSHLMRQLLDFTRPKIVSLQAVDLNNVMREVLDFVRIQFNKGDIEIKSSFSKELPMVYGDPALLYQVFLNIIVNSFHAMPNGGKLSVRTSTEDADEKAQKVIVAVADTGEGIQPEHMSKLFTPFFTTKEPGKGTGLGLAVTKRIVQEHSGTIKVESEVRKGTVVTIQFNAFEPKR